MASEPHPAGDIMLLMLQAAILRYGYAMLFAGAMFEGDASLITGAFLAHRGYFSTPLVILTAALASSAANHVYFWTARTRGREAVKRHLDSGRVPRWLGRALGERAAPLLFGSRFLYGFRLAIPAACGASGMRPATFTAVDVGGALLWATVIGLAGYAIGHGLETWLEDLRRHEWPIAGALLVATLVVLAFRGRDWYGTRVLTAR